ncbi:MAG: protein-disulfide reductase DsbD [Methylococcales bacterium]
MNLITSATDVSFRPSSASHKQYHSLLCACLRALSTNRNPIQVAQVISFPFLRLKRLKSITHIVFLLVFFTIGPVAVPAGEILPPEQAFRLSGEQPSDNTVRLHWDIADGYYLYREKFKFASRTPTIEVGIPELPEGKTKSDDYFGDVEIFRGKVDISVPMKIAGQAPDTTELTVTYQGCADIGICYPPIKTELKLQRAQSLQVDLAPASSDIAGNLRSIGFDPFQNELLPADQAFRFFATVKDGNTVHVDWQIAEGYYLYREKFSFELPKAESVAFGAIDIPRGTPEFDEAFGNVEIFHGRVEFDLPLTRNQSGPVAINLIAHFQGCADRGVCYPPMKESLYLELPSGTLSPASETSSQASSRLSEQDGIALALQHDSLALTMLVFFGYGLLLAFTPCVFPMVPILSGIIVGYGESISTSRAFGLSLCYVLASAITYTIFGVLAGLFGSSLNLQALFQNPAVIMVFSAIFVLLAFSMFGFYSLQAPASIQARLAGFGARRKGGSALAVASMGVVSALIVGPCIAAPLAGALIYIGQTGDAVFGGLALFSMGLGMGFPLLIIGASAGKLLPKAGYWMNATKAVLGVLLLGVAVWMLERIVPPGIAMLLWATLLIIPAIYLRALDTLPESATGWARLWKGCGIILLTAGILLIIGVASGSRDPFRPLNRLARGERQSEQQEVVFTRINSSKELDRYLGKASGAGQWVMLDYYADWCISCKEMAYYTFSDPRVQQALSQLVLVQADVTQDTPENKELLKRFDLIGPPAILFFQPGNQEHRAYRIIGYKDADTFLEHLRQFLTNA